MTNLEYLSKCNGYVLRIYGNSDIGCLKWVIYRIVSEDVQEVMDSCPFGKWHKTFDGIIRSVNREYAKYEWSKHIQF